MIPDPAAISVDQAPETILFPGDEIDRIFGRAGDGHTPPLFRPMWEYPGRRNYSYVCMTRELLNLLHTLKQQGVVRGVQAEFGCSPWPATNITEYPLEGLPEKTGRTPPARRAAGGLQRPGGRKGASGLEEHPGGPGNHRRLHPG